jgi:hypothetical protein
MRISSVSVEAEGNHESDAMTVYRGWLVPGSEPAHFSSGQAHV